MPANSPPLEMPRRHARRLAALDGASERAIVETVSLWPLGARLMLSTLNIIDFRRCEDTEEGDEPPSHDEIHAAARRGEPMDFGVTDDGMKVIAACAEWRRANEPQGAADDAPEPVGGNHDEEWPESLASSDDLELAEEERHAYGC